MLTTVDHLNIKQTATVIKVNGEGPIRKRIMEMGIVKGIEVTIIKKAPLKDPIELLVRGYHLSIRLSEARFIEVEIQ